MTMICAACAKEPSPALVDRELPSAPAGLLKPVPVPPVVRGDKRRASGGREQAEVTLWTSR